MTEDFVQEDGGVLVNGYDYEEEPADGEVLVNGDEERRE